MPAVASSDRLTAAISLPERLAALVAEGLADDGPEPVFDRFARVAARAAGAPVAVVSFVTDTRQHFAGVVGVRQPWADARETPLSHSFCSTSSPATRRSSSRTRGWTPSCARTSRSSTSASSPTPAFRSSASTVTCSAACARSTVPRAYGTRRSSTRCRTSRCSSAPEAFEIVERLRRDMPAGLTASAGVATWATPMHAAQLVAAADRQLYRAKAEGRDPHVRRRIARRARGVRRVPAHGRGQLSRVAGRRSGRACAAARGRPSAGRSRAGSPCP